MIGHTIMNNAQYCPHGVSILVNKIADIFDHLSLCPILIFMPFTYRISLNPYNIDRMILFPFHLKKINKGMERLSQ
jgi:hypothetical protein